ncbi:SMI1/KNR4 family protein [Crateriforma conspicua]|uniref:Knr4/Smi1-like domain-containing protein n=1 Tax=Crateriforma conspicua TaxID=2527996 RepID=A0A5C6FDN4_9PLAN|nr:SMI1/KNR4 family protein [Crateriforma conspicua]TWU59535.1 hypothetical protein V7x_55810 [Crateriforma conspicua]
MTILTDLTKRWAASDVAIREGASHDRIAAFEHEHSVSLPHDVADYFRFVDGMDDTMCDDFFHFWKLDDVRPVHDIMRDGDHDYADRNAYPGYFAFADYLIDSWHYAMLLTDASHQPAPVRFVTFSDPPGGFAADSFRSFIVQYCDDPNMLLC